MNLAEVMQDLANEMEKDVQELESGEADRDSAHLLIKGYVMAIRTAVKMSKSEPAKPTQIVVPTGPDTTWLEKRARREQSQLQDLEQLEEHGFRTAVVADGPAEGDMIPLGPVMQVGFRMKISGQAYELKEDMRLHLVPLV